MKKYRITKKFTAWTVLLVLLVTLLASATVYAQGDPPEAQGPETAGEMQLAGQAQTGGVITAFAVPEESVAKQTAQMGAGMDALVFPAELPATPQGGETVSVPVLEWKCTAAPDGSQFAESAVFDLAGEYIFTAAFADEWTAEDTAPPTITVTVEEAQTIMTAQSVEIGTPGDITPAPASTGTVYFGVDGYNSNAPILWRVVENGGGSMTLFADSFVTTDAGATRVYNTILDHANWSGSDVCAWLNGTGSYTATGFLPMGFSAAEQSAITNYGTTETTNGHSGISIAQKIVLPSYEEMGDGMGTGTWGLTQTDRVTSDPWWLRSPGGINITAVFVDVYGYVAPGDFPGIGHVSYDYAIRPAFKLNLNSVLFTSAATGGKSGAASAILSAAEPPTGNQKLTVFDTVNLQLTSVTPTAINENTITFDYSSATVGETLSAIVTDASGDVTYYGKLATGISASDTGVQVTLPDGFDAATDTLEIFVEDINGDKLTDYASTPVALAVTAQTAPTAPAGGINQITGLTTAMEYKLTSASTWTAATDVTATGLAAGSYEVRFASKFESGTVYAPSPAMTVEVTTPSVTRVSVSPTTANVIVGNTQQFTANVAAQNGAPQTVTWSVDGTDSSIVNGLLTVGANETAATLTVTATSTFDGTKKCTAAVTVIRPVTGITITGDGSISTKGGTLQLAADVLPANADNKAVTWTSGDTGIATVDASGLVTAVANGTVTITATAQDGSGIHGEKRITITGQDAPTPIQYPILSAFAEFTGSGGRSVKIDADNSKFVRLLYDGKVVGTGNYSNTSGSTVITLTESYLKTFANGTYTFRAEFSDGYADLSLVVNVPAAASGTTRGGSDSPETGDESNLNIWIALMMVAGVTIFELIVYRRRKAQENR